MRAIPDLQLKPNWILHLSCLIDIITNKFSTDKEFLKKALQPRKDDKDITTLKDIRNFQHQNNSRRRFSQPLQDKLRKLKKQLRKNDNKGNKKTITNITSVRSPKVEESSFVHTNYLRQSNQSRLNIRGTCCD